MSEQMQYFGAHPQDQTADWTGEEIANKYYGKAVHDEQITYDPFMLKSGSDPRKEIGKKLKAQIQKQSIDTSTGGPGTAGSALIPVWVDSEIVDQTRFETPLRSMIRRLAVRGKTYDFNALTAKGGATWRPEDGSLPEDVDTYDRLSVTIKYGYSVGKLTNPAIAAMRGYVDANALDLAVKTQALMELEEDTIINGDSSSFPNEYDGLIVSIVTNTTDLSGANVSLSDIRGELATTFQARGRTNLIVTDVNTHNFVKSLLQDFQRQPAQPAENLPFGIPGAFEFDGVPHIRSQFMPQTPASRRMLFLDTRFLVLAVLLDFTFQEIPSLNDSRKYMLKVYEALANKYEGAMSQLFGVA